MKLSLPDVRQRAEWSCGQALLETFHLYWNKPLPKPLGALANQFQGLSPDSIDSALRASGFSVMSGTMSVDILKALTTAGLPVGCLVQHEGTGHYVSVAGVERNRVYGNCPLIGSFSQPVGEWNNRWWDGSWIGGEFIKWATCPFMED
jgi:hypothetical protein